MKPVFILRSKFNSTFNQKTCIARNNHTHLKLSPTNANLNKKYPTKSIHREVVSIYKPWLLFLISQLVTMAYPNKTGKHVSFKHKSTRTVMQVFIC